MPVTYMRNLGGLDIRLKDHNTELLMSGCASDSRLRKQRRDHLHQYKARWRGMPDHYGVHALTVKGDLVDHHEKLLVGTGPSWSLRYRLQAWHIARTICPPQDDPVKSLKLLTCAAVLVPTSVTFLVVDEDSRSNLETRIRTKQMQLAELLITVAHPDSMHSLLHFCPPTELLCLGAQSHSLLTIMRDGPQLANGDPK